MSKTVAPFTNSFINERVWNFYKENPKINIEQANVLLIDLMETIFNQMSNDLADNVNAQLLSYMRDNRIQLNTLQTSLDTIQDNVNKSNTDIIQNMVIMKKEYMDDVKQIMTNSTLTTNEKMSLLMDKNNDHLIDKTTLIINNTIPKSQEQYNKQVQDQFTQFYTLISKETQDLAKSGTSEKSLQEFTTQFENKFNVMMQSIQQPIFSLMNASEERINGNIDKLKESSAISLQTQSKVFDELGEFLGKYKGSSNKGKFGEQNLSTILNSMYNTAEIKDTTGLKASGDFIMKRLDKPDILFETKEYDHNMNKDEVAKFIRDIDTQNMSGIFMSQNSGISFKQNFQIDIHKGNVLVYIQNCEYSIDKIRMAVDIIDHMAFRIQELNIDESNNISKEMLDDINNEYQIFIAQKENLVMILKDFQKKMTLQIDDIKMPALDKYLSPKYASVKTNLHVCDICNVFSSTNKQSISAHKRGCIKRNKQKDEDETQPSVTPATSTGPVTTIKLSNKVLTKK